MDALEDRGLDLRVGALRRVDVVEVEERDEPGRSGDGRVNGVEKIGLVRSTVAPSGQSGLMKKKQPLPRKSEYMCPLSVTRL